MKKILAWAAAALATVALGFALSSVTVVSCGSGGNVVWPDDDVASDDDIAPVDDDLSPADDDTTGTFTVTIVDYAFHPSTITVGVGDVVEWINAGAHPHEVRSGNPGEPNVGSVFDSGLLQPGASYGFTFTQAGTYPYFAADDPLQMHGANVIVQ